VLSAALNGARFKLKGIVSYIAGFITVADNSRRSGRYPEKISYGVISQTCLFLAC
jgi:hypothetical protein